MAQSGPPPGLRARIEAMNMHTQEHIANTPERDYLERVTRETGLTLTEIARRAKLAPTTLTRFMSRDDDKHSLRPSTLRAVEQVSRVPLPPELAAAARGMEPTSDQAAEERPGTVPLFSLYAASDHGDFLRNDQPTDIAPRLPGIAHNMRVYAVRMPDASMAPWRQPNELVYIDPTRFASAGDHALVELSHPRDPNHPRSVFRIRRIAARNRDGSLRLTPYDGGETEAVPRERVLGVHRVLEWPEASIG
jgi:phage repressor protein C with HTH and peptisase S24 domain